MHPMHVCTCASSCAWHVRCMRAQVFLSERISEGARGCCLTWRCEVNGSPGPAGISFNQVDAGLATLPYSLLTTRPYPSLLHSLAGTSFNQVDESGKICFARDIPAPSTKPPPLAAIAARLRPGLRTFRARAAAPPAMKLSAAEPPLPPLEIFRTRPTRAAMAAVWIGFSVYVAAFSPGEPWTARPNPSPHPDSPNPGPNRNPHPNPHPTPGEFDLSPASADNRLIADAIADPTSLNPYFFAIFNALGVLPGVNAALLLPGSKGQSPLYAPPFLAAAFALGYGAIGPYLALRQVRDCMRSTPESHTRLRVLITTDCHRLAVPRAGATAAVRAAGRGGLRHAVCDREPVVRPRVARRLARPRLRRRATHTRALLSRVHPALRRAPPLKRPHRACCTSRLYLDCISVVSRLSLGCLSVPTGLRAAPGARPRRRAGRVRRPLRVVEARARLDDRLRSAY